MHIYGPRSAFLCYHLCPVTIPPPSGVMPLHIQLQMLLKQRQSSVLLIKTCLVSRKSCYCGTSISLIKIWLGYRILCVIVNGLMTPQLLLLFTLGHLFLALLELPCVMFEVLSAWHVFVQSNYSDFKDHIKTPSAGED
jgi:hypothetical protein